MPKEDILYYPECGSVIYEADIDADGLFGFCFKCDAETLFIPRKELTIQQMEKYADKELEEYLNNE